MVKSDDLKLLPDKPGVYLMKDAQGKIIYVGKAISLKNRVRSYFQASRKLFRRIELMVEQVDRVEYITTTSEVEALVLECNFIKEERPKYNIRLRDDKQYPWVKITWQESFPQVFLTRKFKRDGSKYYGPYTDGAAIREIMRLLKKIFPLRGCRFDLGQKKIERPCLNYHIKRCLAPCTGEVPPEVYREMIRQICLFLEGRQSQLRDQLWLSMQEAAQEKEYEKAAALRDQVRAIEKILEKQKVVSDTTDEFDVLGIAQDQRGSLVQIFQVRQGKLVGREFFQLEAGDETGAAEILEEFLLQYYDEAGYIPKNILLPLILDNKHVLQAWLVKQRGGNVTVKEPQKGEKYQLIKMAEENARILLEQERLREDTLLDEQQQSLLELQQVLDLEGMPLRIEGFDISNIQGEEAVASMVVFENGKPAGDQYRRFKIKTIEGPNDFAMLKEAIKRRFARGLAEVAEGVTEGKFTRFPDVLLIDGGKGQLSGVMEILYEMGLTEITTISLAKQEEEIYRPEAETPLRLSRRSPALMLLQRVRDEAHRYAITYHRSLRDKRTKSSQLDQLTGIGTKRKQLLLKKFGSVKRIREAGIAEIATLPGISEKLAAKIKEELEGLVND